MITKICFKCGILKELNDFYKHPEMSDGHLGKCKECTKKDTSANYRKNRGHYMEYEKRRGSLRGGTAQKAHRKAAHVIVSNAIRDKRLKRLPCEICGIEKVEAHHDDYDEPFKIKWLCRRHHLQLHGKVAF